MVMVSAHATSAIDGDDLPPAKPGQCFTKAFFPAKYTTITEKVLVSEPSEKVVVVPARYEWDTQKIKVSDGVERTHRSTPHIKLVYEENFGKTGQRVWEDHLVKSLVHLDCLSEYLCSNLHSGSWAWDLGGANALVPCFPFEPFFSPGKFWEGFLTRFLRL